MKSSFISNYILRAIELAQKGKGFVNPNPLVGAVIVKDGKIIGEGFHTCYGKLHAEREALADAKRRGNSCEGADIYVTLEPCCHSGKQPPCTEALIEAGIARVFVGSDDPNPLVAGKGFEILRKAGIQVFTGCLKKECDELNPVFFHYITKKTPYITMKYAVTADGQTACATGDSKWISGEESRKLVHYERAWNMAIMTGINTVLFDDPLLTCRLPAEEGGETVRQPIRVICDSKLRIPLESRLVKTAGEVPVIVACALTEKELAENQKAKNLSEKGVEVLSVPDSNGRVDLQALVKELGNRKIDSVLLESGGELNGAALRAGIVNKIQIFMAPKIVGAANITEIAQSEGKLKACSPVRGILAEHPDKSVKLSKPKLSVIENDVLIEYEVIA